MITGMYRDTQHGTYVEVRGAWGRPDTFYCSWLDKDGELHMEEFSRAEVEHVIRLGFFVRDYRR